MLVRIPGIMSEQEVAAVANALSGAEFVDGRLSAGAAAEKVKHNLELDRGAAIRETLARAVVGSLYRSRTFRDAVLPNKVGTPIFARYIPGMCYGNHVDNPLMGSMEAQYRSDVSCTVFLNDPDSYGGGELIIDSPFGEERVKMAAGDAVIYPSHTLHRVAEVSSGERLVAVLWFQSMVRDAARRELLYDLSMVRESLLRAPEGTGDPGLLDRTYANLLRMWAEP